MKETHFKKGGGKSSYMPNKSAFSVKATFFSWLNFPSINTNNKKRNKLKQHELH